MIAGLAFDDCRSLHLLSVMYGAGLRRSEAVALDTSDIDLKNSQLLVKRSKGNKSRTVYLDLYMTSMVESWLALRGKGAGPLLAGCGRAGFIRIREAFPKVFPLKLSSPSSTG
jgi:integrase/recombinase XerD